MSDQGYGGPPRWEEPHGDPQYGPEPYQAPPPYGQPPYGQPPYGQPQYSQPQYSQPEYGQPTYGQQPNFGQPQYGQPYPSGAQPSSSGGGRTLMLVVLAIVVVAALGVGGFFLFSSDDKNSASTSTSLPPLGQTDPSLPVAPVPLPTISLPTISLPPISLPSISLPSLPQFPAPSGASLLNPCSFASTVTQAATIYVGLAEVGQSTTAQGCVYRTSVPSSVTASLAGSGGTGQLYVPSGRVNGPVVEFATADGTGRLEVTVTKESDGKLYVTKVRKS